MLQFLFKIDFDATICTCGAVKMSIFTLQQTYKKVAVYGKNQRKKRQEKRENILLILNIRNN